MKTIKKILLFILTALILVPLGLAKKEPLVYDHVAHMKYKGRQFDVSASVQAGGQTYWTGCDVTRTTVECTDTPGHAYILFDDGGISAWMPVFTPAHFGQGYHDPVFDIMHATKLGEESSFHYRLAHMKDGSMDLYCVPYEAGVEKFSGKYKAGEACYSYMPDHNKGQDAFIKYVGFTTDHLKTTAQTR